MAMFNACRCMSMCVPRWRLLWTLPGEWWTRARWLPCPGKLACCHLRSPACSSVRQAEPQQALPKGCMSRHFQLWTSAEKWDKADTVGSQLISYLFSIPAQEPF